MSRVFFFGSFRQSTISRVFDNRRLSKGAEEERSKAKAPFFFFFGFAELLSSSPPFASVASVSVRFGFADSATETDCAHRCEERSNYLQLTKKEATIYD
jgi:hypothetical protein